MFNTWSWSAQKKENQTPQHPVDLKQAMFLTSELKSGVQVSNSSSVNQVLSSPLEGKDLRNRETKTLISCVSTFFRSVCVCILWMDHIPRQLDRAECISAILKFSIQAFCWAVCSPLSISQSTSWELRHLWESGLELITTSPSSWFTQTSNLQRERERISFSKMYLSTQRNICTFLSLVEKRSPSAHPEVFQSFPDDKWSVKFLSE